VEAVSYVGGSCGVEFRATDGSGAGMVTPLWTGRLAVRDIRRNFRRGMPASAHRLNVGLVRKAPAAILSDEYRFEEVQLGGKCESVDRGTVIDDGYNERLVQGQESFWIAPLGGMGQNLE